MVVMSPEQPHTAEHAVVGRAYDGSPFGSYYAMAHLELGLQIGALTTLFINGVTFNKLFKFPKIQFPHL